MGTQFCERCQKDRDIIKIIPNRSYAEALLSCGDSARLEQIVPIHSNSTRSKSKSVELAEIFAQINKTDYSPLEKESIRRILEVVNREIKHDPLPKIIDSLGVSLKMYLPLASRYIILLISKFLNSNRSTKRI